jgi:hypothetical protein
MKDEQIPNIQMEHSHSIINLNVTPKKKSFDWALYDNNVFNLLDITKTSKLIDIVPNIERIRSQI